MGRRRQRRDAETQELQDDHWHGIREQWRLEDQHHTPEENRLAHERGMALVEGKLSWEELLGEK